jgi:hypothetical protein
MKKLVIILSVMAFLWACGQSDKHSNSNEHEHHLPTESEVSTTKSKSPKKMAMSNIGDNHVHLEYSSPSVRGRLIFGGLVAYNEVWVTGAHRATSVQFQKDVSINDQRIPAGKYGFFTIPGEDQWIIILNKDWDMHLADNYKESNDIIRVVVNPEILTEPVESLTYEVSESENGTGSIGMSWADRKITLTFQNQ